MEEPIDKILNDQMAGFVDRPGCFEAIACRLRDTYRVLPHIKRDADGVDKRLWDVLRSLTAGSAPWPLYLHGPVGAGKTLAMLVVCDRVEFGRYWTVSDLMDRMVLKDPPWDWPIEPVLPILDELGLQRCDADARGKFEFDAVKRFLDWREQRPAIYISNHPLGTIWQLYDRRIQSRLGAGTVHFLDGPDRRFQEETP